MINLMPSDEKRQIRAGRVNVILMRYIIISVCTFVFLLMAIGFAYYILTSVKQSADNLLSNSHTQALATSNASTQLRQFQNSLGQAQYSFSTDLNYTNALSRIAALMPSGVVLSSLSLDATSFGTPTTIQAIAKTNAGISDFQAKLQSSPYFSGVSLESITSTSGDPAYPVSASIAATINRTIAQ